MLKTAYHPNAYLTKKRNLCTGLKARSKVLLVLEKKTLDTKNIAVETDLSYSVALHHLHLLEDEHTVTHYNRRPYYWRITGAGQRRLT